MFSEVHYYNHLSTEHLMPRCEDVKKQQSSKTRKDDDNEIGEEN